MWCTTPEISWHNRDPVLSIDIQGGTYETPKGDSFWRIATGGADSHVLIWHLMLSENGGVKLKCVTDLERHQKAVNVVRFSPSKEILASGDDESVIVLWKQKEDCEFFVPSDDAENKEQWVSWKVLRGHLEDVYDISWSPDSRSLVSGSVDNTAILWDIRKGRPTSVLTDHKGFVQGVSWDPCNQYICTISTDRLCRLIDISTKKTVQRLYKSKIPTPPDHPLKNKSVRLFYDDTFKSFFRRLTFTLDGTLIIVPSGIIEPSENTEKVSNATIIFSKQNLKEPVMILPSLDECTIAVRCCPIYFELQKDGPSPVVALPYRMVFAVATQHSILLYDTQQTSPIAVISNIHYTRLTDISWSSNGRILIASSTDGYCSVIHFQENELGREYKNANNISVKPSGNDNCKESEESIDSKSNKESLPTHDIDNSAMDIDIAKPDQVLTATAETVNTGKNEEKFTESNDVQGKSNINSKEMAEETEDIELVYNEDSTNDNSKMNVKSIPKVDLSQNIGSKMPRRVQLITLSSPKRPKK